jgi:hypothetical protein
MQFVDDRQAKQIGEFQDHQTLTPMPDSGPNKGHRTTAANDAGLGLLRGGKGYPIVKEKPPYGRADALTAGKGCKNL